MQLCGWLNMYYALGPIYREYFYYMNALLSLEQVLSIFQTEQML